MSTNDNPTGLAVAERGAPPDDRLAHLVLKSDWPIALCKARVSERFGAAAAGRDRCPDCLRIARFRKLGRPGWV